MLWPLPFWLKCTSVLTCHPDSHLPSLQKGKMASAVAAAVGQGDRSVTSNSPNIFAIKFCADWTRSHEKSMDWRPVHADFSIQHRKYFAHGTRLDS